MNNRDRDKAAGQAAALWKSGNLEIWKSGWVHFSYNNFIISWSFRVACNSYNVGNSFS